MTRKPDHNRTTHGRALIKLGKFPASRRYLGEQMRRLQRFLEDQCAQRWGGEVSATRAAYVQTSVRCEAEARSIQAYLAEADDKLDPEQKAKFLEQISKASARRDKALEKLDLDGVSSSPFDAAFAATVDVTPAQANQTAHAPRGATIDDADDSTDVSTGETHSEDESEESEA